MTPSAVDRIILGHNPFFGINHLDANQGELKAQSFEQTEKIIEVLDHCHTMGVRGLMMSSHQRATALCQTLRSTQRFAGEWNIYPLIPNIQKYVRGANQKGLVNLLIESLTQAGMGKTLSTLWSGGKSLLTKDARAMLTTLIDIELLPFTGLHLNTIFLHDALTDLALGLGLDEMLDVFRDHVTKKYHTSVGLTTKNFPLLQQRLEKRGWTNPTVMASFNAAGFYVNPSLESCAEAVRRPGTHFVAMNTLASGFLKPEEAYAYFAGFGDSIRSVAVGLSRKDHATQTIETLRRYLPAFKA